METRRFDFIFNHALVLRAEVAEHLREDKFQFFVADATGFPVMVEAGIRDVESRAELMSRRIGGVAVYAAQFLDRVRGAEHACDAHAVTRGIVAFERVVEIASDRFE